MRYKYHKNVHAKRKRLQWAHSTLFLLLCLVVVIGIVGGSFVWWAYIRPQAVEMSNVKSHVITASVLGRTENDRFSFQSLLGWEFMPEESSLPTTYHYRHVQGSLVLRELTVYLDTTVVPQVTYILPVEANGGTLVPGSLSPKCSMPKGARQDPVQQVHESVSFICVPDSNEMIVAAGLRDGSYSLPLVDTKGRTHTVGLVYRDSQVRPDPYIFSELVSSFTLK